MSTVTTSFEFLQWQSCYETQKPYEVFLPVASFGDKSVPRSNLVFETRSVEVDDVGSRRDDFTLDTHSFQFVRCPTAVPDLKDRQAVRQRYIPEMEAFLKRHLGGSPRTFCFDLRVRTAAPPPFFGSAPTADSCIAEAAREHRPGRVLQADHQPRRRV